MYVGIGSNLDGPLDQVRRAAIALQGIPGCIGWRFSEAYTTKPVGPADQPDYVNAVGAAMTQRQPHALLDALLAIESDAGRIRDGTRWGPRCLDLDLLSVGQLTIDDERLTLPHPELANRQFVLTPLAACAPFAVIPGLGSLKAAVARFDTVLPIVGALT